MRIKILVRRNLKMTDKKMSSQCVHAALGLKEKNPQAHWACVVLDASDKKFEEAKALHPEGYVVRDAGLTEVAPGSETCLAFYEIDPREEELKARLVEMVDTLALRASG